MRTTRDNGGAGASERTLHLRRAKLEAHIEQMIALLDELDGDPDFEEGGDDEPSIGAFGRISKHGLQYDLEDDQSDSEPDLGWSNPRFPGEDFKMPEGWGGCDAQDTCSSVGFRGDGQRIARKMLRKLKAA